MENIAGLHFSLNFIHPLLADTHTHTHGLPWQFPMQVANLIADWKSGTLFLLILLFTTFANKLNYLPL